MILQCSNNLILPLSHNIRDTRFLSIAYGRRTETIVFLIGGKMRTKLNEG